MKRLSVLLLTVIVAGCGDTAALRPKTGDTLPPKPLAAKTVPTADDLIRPSDQSRPVRSDELLQNSEVRPQDRFDLPPSH